MKRTQEKHFVLRRRRDGIAYGIAAVLAVGGGAALGAAIGAAIAERRPKRKVVASRPEPGPLGSRGAAEPRPRRQSDPVAPVVADEKGSLPGRRLAGIAYAIAVVLLLTGGGLMGVAIASQREAPQPPPGPALAAPAAPEAVPAPEAVLAPETVPQRAPAPLEEHVRAMAPRHRQLVVEQPTPLTLPPSPPVALEIPSIDVDAVVRHLGLTEDGALETPAGPHYNDAAWYRHSPAPGSLGPSILLGHVDSAADGPSVFFRLGEVRAGDRVKVTRADGSAAVFVVDDVRRFAKKDFPTELVYGDIDHAGLRILTCGGPFDEVSGHYLDNVVVFASLVEE